MKKHITNKNKNSCLTKIFLFGVIIFFLNMQGYTQSDPYQTRNVYAEHPAVVSDLAERLQTMREQIPASERLGWINLNQSAGRRKPRGTSTNGAAPKTPAGPTERSASFDFESGKLTPWKVLAGEFGHLIFGVF